MSAVFFTALIALPLIIFPAIAILGWGHTKAREYLSKAAAAAGNGQFPAARQYVLNATRFNPSFKSSQRLVTFYDKILTQASIATEEITQIQSLAEQWPKSRFERIWANDVFKVLFFAFIGLSILVRFASLP